MNAITIISPLTAELDASLLDRAEDIADHMDATGGYFLKMRVGSAWAEMGQWYSPRDAMQRAKGAVGWIEVSPFTWMSVCGKYVVRR